MDSKGANIRSGLRKKSSWSRARARGRVAPVKTETLQDLLAPHLPAAVQAWVDGLSANKPMWNPITRKWEDTGLPEHKVRADCARAIVEYVVGKAIERSMEVTGSYKELSVVLDEFKQSPEARRLLPSELFSMFTDSGQTTTEGKESAPPHESEPKPNPE